MKLLESIQVYFEIVSVGFLAIVLFAACSLYIVSLFNIAFNYILK